MSGLDSVETLSAEHLDEQIHIAVRAGGARQRDGAWEIRVRQGLMGWGVPTARVEAALDQLLADGDIYLTNEGYARLSDE